jgi:hypothetical protein
MNANKHESVRCPAFTRFPGARLSQPQRSRMLDVLRVRTPALRRPRNCADFLATKRFVVAQVGNLLYPRLAVGQASNCAVPADCQSAKQQTASLRYRIAAIAAPGSCVIHSHENKNSHY